MKDSNTASDIDYQSMVKNIIDDFTSPTQIATEDTPEASNDAYINGLLLLIYKCRVSVPNSQLGLNPLIV